MEYTPCEQMNFKGLASIRGEMVHSMIKQFSIKQREAAEILGVTPAAISQYLSKKRGYTTQFDNDIIKEIDKSAKRIYSEGRKHIGTEICRICKLMRKDKQELHVLSIYND
jgi:predicted transcriptional regulator